MLKDIIRKNEIELARTEVEFEIKYKFKLPSDKLDQLTDDFIDIIESHQIYCGGGYGGSYLSGVIDLGNSPLTIDKGIKLIEEFAGKQIELIEEIRIKALPNEFTSTII